MDIIYHIKCLLVYLWSLNPARLLYPDLWSLNQTDYPDGSYFDVLQCSAELKIILSGAEQIFFYTGSTAKSRFIYQDVLINRDFAVLTGDTCLGMSVYFFKS